MKRGKEKRIKLHKNGVKGLKGAFFMIMIYAQHNIYNCGLIDITGHKI